MQSNQSRAQDYLMQIVSAGYGFDVPDIQKALVKTNYKSVEAAVEYLFKMQSEKSSSSNQNISSNANQSKSKNSTSDIQLLKDRIAKIEIDGKFKLNVTTDIIKSAIKENKSTDEALNYIMDKYSHLIKPNESTTIQTKEDKEKYKQKLKEEAKKKKEEQEKEARRRAKQIQMDKERAEREEKEKEESRRLHKQRIAQNKAKIQNKQKKKKVSAQKATLDWHKRHEQYDKMDIMKRQQIEKNRLKSTANIDSPDKALRVLFDRYGEDKAKETITVMTKIVNNILKHPKDEKYAKLNLSNAKIMASIVTPLGALKFFEFLGFEELIEKDKIFPNDVLKQKKFLIYRNFNENDCKQAVLMLNKYNETQKTLIYDYVQRINEDKNIQISPDNLYIALLHLQMILNNIRISPNSQHLRVIEVENEIFKKRVGQYKIFQKLLKNLGYRLENQIKGKVFILHQRNGDDEREKEMKYLKDVCRDLSKIAHDDVLMNTNIGIGIKKIYDHNSQCVNELYKYFNTLIKAMERVLEEPLNMKFQTINGQKLKTKFANLTGVVSVLKLMGFKKSKEDKTKFVLSEEYNGDLDLLKWRKTMLVNVISDKKLLKKKVSK